MTDQQIRAAALRCAVEAMGWTDAKMIEHAGMIANGYSFGSFGLGGECCLTGPQVMHFRSCYAGAYAAVSRSVNGFEAMREALERIAKGHLEWMAYDTGDMQEIARTALKAASDE